MKKKTIIHSFRKRAALTLLVVLFASLSSWAQYVFVIANPSGSGEVRVGKTTDLGAYMDGSHFVWDAEPGETIYFDFRPYNGYQFTGEITNDANLTDITLLDNGLYSFTMPEYEGTFFINIKINFEAGGDPVVVEGVNINEENFPDANFRKWLLAQSYGKDAVITNEEIAGITKISAQGCGIADLTGIGFFTQLRTLWCSNNQISSLDLSQCPDLRNLQCDNNLLTELNVTNCPYLNMFSCTNNQLTVLDVTHNPDLAVLTCYGNQLTSLDVTNCTLLEQLYCENNQLTAITGLSNHDKLQNFNCNNNQLTSLDLAGCTALYHLYCYNNKIKGVAMTNLVNSLETPPHGGYMVVIDLESDVEENEMTDEQAAAAKAKRWSVEAWLIDDSVPYPYDPDNHQFVDLGLPSGTLWATCNIGAIQPYHSGLFFAWGDTEGHGSDVSDGYWFNWENYKWGEVIGEDTWLTKYCSDSARGLDGFTDGKYELDLEDDAAYVNWGPQWRMPSKEQFDELMSECTWTRMYLGDVYGYDVEGPNGRSIFLPDTGWRLDDMLLDGGAFWSRTSNPEDVAGAYYLGWNAYEWEHFEWYEFGGRLDGQCIRPVVNRFIELADDADNSEVIEAASSSGTTYDVKLTGRTLYKDGSWNTLCLPFTLDAEQVETLLDSPEKIMTLDTSDFDKETGTLTLNFEEVSAIDAGTPYIIKWARTDGYTDDNEHNLYEPTFTSVTVSDATETVESDYARFIGTTSPLALVANDRTKLYFSGVKTLYYPNDDVTINSCRAYFELKGGIIAGDKDNEAHVFRMNFGNNEATAINTLTTLPDGEEDDNFYSIDGRRLNGKPTVKGVYINNGHKLFIK